MKESAGEGGDEAERGGKREGFQSLPLRPPQFLKSSWCVRACRSHSAVDLQQKHLHSPLSLFLAEKIWDFYFFIFCLFASSWISPVGKKRPM